MRKDLIRLARRKIGADLAEEVVQETYLVLIEWGAYRSWSRSRMEARERIERKVLRQCQRKRVTEARHTRKGGDDGRTGHEYDAGLDGGIADRGAE
jgi:DNA-directed RNA polymerase specialized sigma24 family protein